jgi:hypothetical protein
MHVLIKSILENVQARSIECIVGFLAVSLPTILVLYTSPIAIWLKELPPLWLVGLPATLLAICLALGAWMIFLRPKLRFDEPTGTYADAKSTLRYCAFCYNTHKKKIPLKNKDHGWQYVVCNKSFSDPSRPRHPIPEWQPLDPDVGY